MSSETTMSRARTLVAVYSPKGGAGTTTLATNVATVMAERRPGRVAIIDLDLQFGQVATHLNVRPRQTLADLARDDQSRRDIELIRSYAALTSYGLAVFAAPGSPELAETVTVAHVEELLSTTCAAYEASSSTPARTSTSGACPSSIGPRAWSSRSTPTSPRSRRSTC